MIQLETAPLITNDAITLWTMRAVAAGIVLTASWGIRRFIQVVDTMVRDVAVLHDRVTRIEVRTGIVTDERKAER